MSDNLILEHLRAIRSDIADLKRDVVTMNINLASMGQQLGALTTAVYSGKGEMEDIKRRVERIETRLDLTEAH